MKNKKSIDLVVIVVSVIVFILLVINMFSSSKMICKNSFDQSKNGYILDTKYVIESKKNIVKRVKITEIIKSDNKKILEDFKNQYEKQYSYNKNNYGGYDYEIVNKKDSIVVRVNINYRYLDMKKFIKDNGAMKKFTVNNKLTLNGAKKLYESMGTKCK